MFLRNQMSAVLPERGMMQGKLRSRRGVTLTEMLVSLALLSILAVGVSTGISAAAAAQRDSVALSEASLLLDSVTKVVIGELRYATEVDGSAASAIIPPAGYTQGYTSPATYLSTVYGLDARFYTAVGPGGMPRIFIEAGGVSYPILGEGTYSDLGAELELLEYDGGTGCFLVKLAIKLPNGTVQTYPQFTVNPVFRV